MPPFESTRARERSHESDPAHRAGRSAAALGGPAAQPVIESANPACRSALRRLFRFARFDPTILIEGESGTGKTVLARAAHDHSPRAGGKFVPVNLGALDDSLASAELFGYVRGSFTGAVGHRHGLLASAAGGTVFLDEIGKASLAIQQRLLTVIEQHTLRPVGSDRETAVDLRFIVASNTPISWLVEQVAFLPDLAARISAFRIVLPPLRDRREDIPALVSASIARHARNFGYNGDAPTFDQRLLTVLQRAPWPDNIRGLDNLVQRLLVAGEGSSVITLGHCTEEDLLFLQRIAIGADRAVPMTPQRAADLVEQAGSISAAARLSQSARSTLQRHLDMVDSPLRKRSRKRP
jgi:DNA-binding NtrC family response regulator